MDCKRTKSFQLNKFMSEILFLMFYIIICQKKRRLHSYTFENESVTESVTTKPLSSKRFKGKLHGYTFFGGQSPISDFLGKLNFFLT